MENPGGQHPTRCDRCKGRAFAAELLAQTVRAGIERHDQEDRERQDQAEPDRSRHAA
ncbi:hypothetical protein ACFWNC_26750 [Streptomyces sp. NPDC058369]|uniref:hypothetical protein n=1 Tax=Streptomyces sp. NPDC058369 TaxID=3346462 RepID=UPI003651BA07